MGEKLLQRLLSSNRLFIYLFFFPTEATCWDVHTRRRADVLCGVHGILFLLFFRSVLDSWAQLNPKKKSRFSHLRCCCFSRLFSSRKRQQREKSSGLSSVKYWFFSFQSGSRSGGVVPGIQKWFSHFSFINAWAFFPRSSRRDYASQSLCTHTRRWLLRNPNMELREPNKSIMTTRKQEENLIMKKRKSSRASSSIKGLHTRRRRRIAFFLLLTLKSSFW